MTAEICRIDARRQADIRLKNEPFPLCGRLLPAYENGAWSYTVERFAPSATGEMTFPEENYDYAEMAGDCFFVGAYQDGECVGLAIYRRSWNKYLYLYDLKVSARARRGGIGRQLIEEGKRLARENGYRGIYTVGQDNNLNACLFYLKTGFEIGGMDTCVYRGTAQEGKSDVLFYLELDGEKEK